MAILINGPPNHLGIAAYNIRQLALSDGNSRRTVPKENVTHQDDGNRQRLLQRVCWEVRDYKDPVSKLVSEDPFPLVREAPSPKKVDGLHQR